MLAPELKETKRIQSQSDACPRNKHLLTFDFSSSSKMAFLGLGGGRFSSLSAGRSGSCLMIPDGQREDEQPSTSWNREHFLRGWCEATRRFTLLLQHLVGIRDLGLIRQRHRPAVDQLQNLLFNRLWRAWAQVLTPNTPMSNTQHTPKQRTPVLHQQTPWKAAGTSYLGRNHFDELIEEAELAHFAVKPLATVFHTCFQNLEGEKLPETQVNPGKFQNTHWQFQLIWTVHFRQKSKSVPSLKSTLDSLLPSGATAHSLFSSTSLSGLHPIKNISVFTV